MPECGLAVALVTHWTRKHRSHAYLVYDGNEGTTCDSVTLRNLKIRCQHYSARGIQFLSDTRSRKLK